MSTELRGSRRRKGCEKARLYRKKARREMLGLIARRIGFDTGNRIQIASKLKVNRGKRDMQKKVSCRELPELFFRQNHGKVRAQNGARRNR